MGKEPAGSGLKADEAVYYRAVEDHFGRLRGTPFLFSPKDFALLRGWWSEGVPLAAVLAGIAEVFERRAAAGDDPVSSLSYCRHAVARHAKRLTPAGEPTGVERLDVEAVLLALIRELRRAVVRWSDEPVLAGELERMAAAVVSLSPLSDPAALDEALARIEVSVVERLGAALPAAARDLVEGAVSAAVAGVQLPEDVRQRTERAVRLRAIREVLGFPRLALEADGA